MLASSMIFKGDTTMRGKMRERENHKEFKTITSVGLGLQHVKVYQDTVKIDE